MRPTPSWCRHRRCPGRRSSLDTRSRTRHAPPSRPWPSRARRAGSSTRPSCAIFASSALSRFFMVSSSWRCHTLRTPAGEIEWPRWRLVGDPDLAEGGLLKRQREDQRLNLGRRPVGQKRLAPRQLLERQLASGLVEILEAIEAVARVAHHLAGLAHVAELPGELQQAQLGADDLLFLGHDRCPLERRGRALRTPTNSAPGLGSRFSLMTPSVRSSVDYCSGDRGPKRRRPACETAPARA